MRIINPIQKFRADKPKSVHTLLKMLKPKLENNPYLTNNFLDELRNKDKYAHECSDYACDHWDPNPDFSTGIAYPRDIINYYVTNGITGKNSKILDTSIKVIDKENYLNDKIQRLKQRPIMKKQLAYYEHDKIKGTENYKVIPHYEVKRIIPNYAQIRKLRKQVKDIQRNPPKYAQIYIGEGNLVTSTNTKIRIKTVYRYLKGGEYVKSNR